MAGSLGRKALPRSGFRELRSLLVVNGERSRRTVINERPENLNVDPDGADPVIHGFAADPATPEDMLLRLIDEHPNTVALALRRRKHLPPAGGRRRDAAPPGEVLTGWSWRDAGRPVSIVRGFG